MLPKWMVWDGFSAFWCYPYTYAFAYALATSPELLLPWKFQTSSVHFRIITDKCRWLAVLLVVIHLWCLHFLWACLSWPYNPFQNIMILLISCIGDDWGVFQTGIISPHYLYHGFVYPSLILYKTIVTKWHDTASFHWCRVVCKLCFDEFSQ